MSQEGRQSADRPQAIHPLGLPSFEITPFGKVGIEHDPRSIVAKSKSDFPFLDALEAHDLGLIFPRSFLGFLLCLLFSWSTLFDTHVHDRHDARFDDVQNKKKGTNTMSDYLFRDTFKASAFRASSENARHVSSSRSYLYFPRRVLSFDCALSCLGCF